MKKVRNHAIRSLPEGTDCLMVNRVEGAHVEENRWREMLKALGLTQRELAESIGLDRGYLSRIVNGRVEGTERVYVLVEQVHGIRRAWLRGGDGPMRTEEALTSDQRRLLALVEELDENEARAVLAFIRCLREEARRR